MKHLPPRRSSLFLLELMIAILFFSLASAVCVRFFAQSHQLSEDAAQLHMAVMQAQNIEEAVSGYNGSMEEIALLFPGCTATDEKMTIYYDENWNLCAESDSAYYLTLTLSGDTLLSGEILVFAQEESKALYQLPVKIKIPSVF